jgi:hypothetical protein
MTDPLTVIRDADPADGAMPDSAARERMDAALDRLLATEPLVHPASRANRTCRSRRTRALAGAAATIVVAAGVASLPSGGDRSPIAPAPASAAEALRRLGATAADSSTPDSRYIYVRQRSYTTHMRPRPGRRGTFATVVPTDVETWFARDGNERIERYHELWDQATYPTDRDRADAQAAGPLSQPPDDRRAVRHRDTTIAGFTVAKLRALPTDASALRARLERADLGYKSPSPLVTVTGLVLGSPLTPPHVRAAAFAVLRDLPGATLVPGAKDPMGRGGDAVEFNDDAWRTMYIFDPNTSELIATRSIGKKELPGRKITDWILKLDSAGVDRAPNAIDPVVMPDGTTYVPSSNEPTPPA